MSFLKKIFLLFILFILVFSVNTLANDNISLDDYNTLDAKNISYNSHNNTIIASGDVNFKTKTFTLETDELSINLKEKNVSSSGNEFTLIEEDREITGEKINFNYGNNTGGFYNAESKIDDLKFRGKKINFVEKKEYESQVNEASFTKCILEDPHYQIKANRLKIYPDNKVVAQNVQFWWGDLKVFYLPSYVIEYSSDKESGEDKLGSSSPVPRFGYNSNLGVTAELIYPYEIAENSTGKVTMNVVQRGDQDYNIEHKHQFDEDTFWTGNYNYDKNIEENTDTEADKIVEQDFNSRLEHNINNNLTVFNNYNYNWEKENDGKPSIENKLAGGFNFNKENLALLSTIAYDYMAEEREEVIDFSYSLPYSHNFDFYHQYRDEELNKNSYQLSSSSYPVDWSLKYKNGYDLDQLPYLDLDFNKFHGLKTDIGLGILEEDEKIYNKAKVAFKYNKKIPLTENTSIILSENYKHYFYQSENKKEVEEYQGLLSTMTFENSFKLKDKLDLNTSISWNKNITEGDFLISDDEIEEKNNFNYNFNFKLKTPEPQSYLDIDNNGEYSLRDKEFNKMELGVKRTLDCHSYSFNYEFIEKEFRINFSIF
ncbi:MAG: hypothetical protein ACOCRX_04255 [Candidatus Woesearchaeota archaeon]